ncbi:diguanylate cyclase domain-containing protein [Thiomicrospira sp. WB1]|uniref:diguanylate cyclase domain-containing protein n=1 Tax=Thiomicrospira sp. WB1 TaxID=1685380 RepID=UPI0007488166|nr:diguanylate cyclase [Thiomicrospira sp. WB1]KUJ72163.1 hypothetical protein AVO41_06990 [Thiomicrospira sp. WB1]
MALIGTIALVLHLTQTLRLTEELFRLEIQNLSKQVHRHFEHVQKSVQSRYTQIAHLYESRPELLQRIRTQDHDGLYALLKSDYQALREEMPQLYVMHLFNERNVTLLRLHKPASWGDDLTQIRPMMAKANRSGEVQHGFEAGKNGITYRVSVPMVSSGQPLGVLEFGIEPVYFTTDLAEHYQVSSRLLVPQGKLSHLVRSVSFGTIGDYAVIKRDPVFDQLAIGVSEPTGLIHQGERTFVFISDLTLPNYLGQDVVRVQVVKDITERYNHHYQELYAQVGMNVIALFLMLVLLHILLRRFQLASIRSERKLRHLRKQNRAFQQSNERDELTQCFNRRYFKKRLRRLLARERHTSCALLFFDIDYFKEINDECGHLVGDQILSELAVFVRQNVRDGDALIRWGGEEFALILEGVALADARDVAEKLRALAQEKTWVEGVRMTLSFGVTMIQPGDDLKSLQDRVDKLLYDAKHGGRNQVCAG